MGIEEFSPLGSCPTIFAVAAASGNQEIEIKFTNDAPRVITEESSRRYKHRYNLIIQGFVLRIRTQPRKGISRGAHKEEEERANDDDDDDNEPSGNAENIFADFPAFQKQSRSRARSNMKVAYGSLRMSIRRRRVENAYAASHFVESKGVLRHTICRPRRGRIDLDSPSRRFLRLYRNYADVFATERDPVSFFPVRETKRKSVAYVRL